MPEDRVTNDGNVPISELKLPYWLEAARSSFFKALLFPKEKSVILLFVCLFLFLFLFFSQELLEFSVFFFIVPLQMITLYYYDDRTNKKLKRINKLFPCHDRHCIYKSELPSHFLKLDCLLQCV